MNKVSNKKFKDGSLYEGELHVDGTRHGKGIMYFLNKHIYFGDWSRDQFHGKGTYVFNSGERFEGDLVNGMKNGKGDFYYINGNVYHGYWKNDEKHGKGELEFANGDYF